MERRVMVTICGRMIYFEDMIQIASAYSIMGCNVLLPFVKKGGDAISDSELDQHHRDKIDISDIVHFCHIEDQGDSTEREYKYAIKKKKDIWSVIPPLEYLNTYIKDNPPIIVVGPLRWKDNGKSYDIVDAFNKHVRVEGED